MALESVSPLRQEQVTTRYTVNHITGQTITYEVVNASGKGGNQSQEADAAIKCRIIKDGALGASRYDPMPTPYQGQRCASSLAGRVVVPVADAVGVDPRVDQFQLTHSDQYPYPVGRFRGGHGGRMITITITGDNVAEFCAADRDAQWWWWHPDHGLAIVTDTPLPFGAVYLMPWDAAWFAQWGADWQAAADQLNEVIGAALRDLI